VEELKKAKVKPLNYSQVTVVQQLLEENPYLLQRLKDAIRKHTTVCSALSNIYKNLLQRKILSKKLFVFSADLVKL
jgi:hypothetical protein